jgi:hypothetical protein
LTGPGCERPPVHRHTEKTILFMVTIPLISTNNDLFKRLAAVIDSRPQDGYKLHHLSTLNSAKEFLNSEMPELIFIDFSDSLPLLEAPHCDLWLRHGGVIALCEECQTIDRINAVRDANVLVSLTFADMAQQLPGILGIIHDNRKLLSLRAQNEWNGVVSGAFRIRNNLFEAACVINLICNYLYHSDKLTLERKYFFHLPLYELLVNAIEHGNCGISYHEKSIYLGHGGCAPDLIQEKCSNPAVALKTVALKYELHPSFARFVISDEGRGFDWRTAIKTLPHKNLLRLHGRGILIASETARSLHYNEKGNEVSLDIGYETAESGVCALTRPF